MGIRLFLAPIIFFLALVVLRMHVWLRDAWRTRSPQQTGKRLQVTGGILFGAGGVGLSLLALAIATSFNWDHLDFMIAMTVYLWLPMTVTGVLVVFLGGRIGRGVSVADDALLDGLRISGWVLLGLAVMSVRRSFLAGRAGAGSGTFSSGNHRHHSPGGIDRIIG